MRRLLELLTLLLVSLLAAHCGGGGGGGGSDPAAVASVRVTPAGLNLGVGQTTLVTAEALNADGVVLTGKTFTFSSSDTAIATVTAAANPATVTAVAAGSATISASSDGKTSPPASVTVTALADIQVTGRVIDGETRAGIANAGIDFIGTGSPTVFSTVAAADGSFSFAVPDAGSLGTVVDVTARKTGYVSTTLWLSPVRPGGTQIETILLVRENATPGAISGAVRNARNNDGIAGARVTLYRGQGVPIDLVGETTSDPGGGFSFNGLAAGTYSLVATRAGFRQGTRTAIPVTIGAVDAQDVLVSPEGAAAEVRIVLTWGSVPRDLDAHLTGPDPIPADPSNRFHEYFATKDHLDASAAPFAGLDLDDTDSNGPETMTISQLRSGVYRFSVHDFTNRASPASTELGRSGAKVVVYSRDAPTQAYFVPNQSGNLWTVFELSGDIAIPTITPRNSMGFAEDPVTIP